MHLLEKKIAEHAKSLGFKIDHATFDKNPRQAWAQLKNDPDIYFYFGDLPEYITIRIRGTYTKHHFSPEAFLGISEVRLIKDLDFTRKKKEE